MTSRFDDEENMNEGKCCLDSVHFRDTTDKLMLAAMVLVLSGLLVSTVGYVIPRDYKPPPGVSAKEAEARSLYYADLGTRLDICIVVGMVLIAIGGLLTSAVFMKTVVCANCSSDDNVEVLSLTRINDSTAGDTRQSYGTVNTN